MTGCQIRNCSKTAWGFNPKSYCRTLIGSVGSLGKTASTRNATTLAAIRSVMAGVVGPGLLAHRVGDEPRGVPVLLHVRTAVAVVLDGTGGVRGGVRDRVRREGQVRARADVLGEVGEGLQYAVDHGLEEAWVVEVVPQLVDPRQLQPLGLKCRERFGEVLAVLTAARVRGVRAGGEDENAAAAIGDHLAQGVRQIRRPVAVAPVDRQAQAVVGEVLAEGVDDEQGGPRQASAMAARGRETASITSA